MGQSRAFTLKEVLIGLVIIGLLTALLFPVYQIARYRALEARCRANLWAILLKYKQLKTEFNGKVGTKEFIEAFRAWMASPEGREAIYCPLTHHSYSISERANFHCYVENPNIRQEFLAVDSPIMVAWCSCHRQPISPDCIHIPHVMGEKYLAALDIGDGQVRYARWNELRVVLWDQQEIRRRFEECRRWMRERGLRFPTPE